MSFWLIVLFLTAVIALICFYPLLSGTKERPQVERDELNKAFYFQRLTEIEREAAQGLLDNAEQIKAELQQTLLEDIPQQVSTKERSAKSYGKLWFASGFFALAIVSSAVYFSVGSWQAEQMLAHTQSKLAHFQQRLMNEQSEPFNEVELQQFSTALRLHLQQSPKDAKSWWLLGQIAMNTDRGQLALDSYKRAYQLDKDNVEYKLAYARILMFSEDAADKSQGESLLKEVIRQDHSNLDALGLLAFHYFEKEDYKMAAVSWAMMLKLLPENDPRVDVIERSMNAARAAQEEKEQTPFTSEK